jgi:pyruvate/2-oxoglutarate dehydrogenase complex dihydrolipoamide acyltransferase (E2) component
MHEVILPKVGLYDGTVTLIEWLVADGAYVRPGDPIFIMESEKVEMEIETEEEGWIHPEAEPGLEAPIGTRIGVISVTEIERQAMVGQR